jgi:SAM-dependent methyltransferase
MLPRIGVFAERLIETVPARCQILEIGAGDGELAVALAAAGHELVAIDRERRTTFPVLVTDFESYHSGSTRFDCVVASLALHHLHDLKKTLDKVHSILRRKGIIAIDDYGWERLDDAGARRKWGDSWRRELQEWRAERADLHRSDDMLRALDQRFTRVTYEDHAYFDDGAGDDSLAFTYFGRRR